MTCISLVGREGGAAAEGSVALTKLPGRITTGTVDEEHTHTHHLKGENYVLFSRYTQDISPGFSLSDISEKVFQRGKGRARIYSFCKKKKNKNIRNLNMKRQTSPGNEFKPFSMYGKMQGTGLTEIIP